MSNREKELDMMRARIHQERLLSELKSKTISDIEFKEKFDYWEKVFLGHAPKESEIIELPIIYEKPTADINYTHEIINEISKLTQELQNIDIEKAHLSNKSVSTKTTDLEITKAILKKRQEWIELKARIDYIKDNGRLPETINEDNTLPNDRYELQKLIDKTKFSVDNYKKRSKTSKTEISRKQNEIKYSQALVKLQAMNDKMKDLNDIL
jgi:hypothetical protein